MVTQNAVEKTCMCEGSNIYVRMYTCPSARMHAWHLYLSVLPCANLCLCLCLFLCFCAHIYVYSYVYVYARTCTCVCACTGRCRHGPLHLYLQVHVHAHVQAAVSVSTRRQSLVHRSGSGRRDPRNPPVPGRRARSRRPPEAWGRKGSRRRRGEAVLHHLNETPGMAASPRAFQKELGLPAQ